MHVLRDRKLLSVIFGGCCGRGAHAEGLSHQKSGPSQLRGQKPKVGIARTVTPGEAAGDGPRFLPGPGVRRQSSAGTGLCPSAPRVGLSRRRWSRWVGGPPYSRGTSSSLMASAVTRFWIRSCSEAWA